MQFPLNIIVAVLALAAPAGQALAAAAPAPLAVASPDYRTLVLETDVARPAAQVWARVGKYCDITEWLGLPCVLAGKDGQVGSVRTLNGGAVIEMIVGGTDLSYTYAQPVRVGTPYNAYHGTVAARPLTPTTSRLSITFFYDTSMLGDEAARAAERSARTARWTGALQNMKILAEGGTLPPAPR